MEDINWWELSRKIDEKSAEKDRTQMKLLSLTCSFPKLKYHVNGLTRRVMYDPIEEYYAPTLFNNWIYKTFVLSV